MAYNLNQLAAFTGLTTRTLRNYLKTDILQGEKIDGNWSFTEEELARFLNDPTVKQAISSKHHGVVYDFLADTYKKTNRICTILDFPVSEEEARSISEFFCREITERGHDIEFRFLLEKNVARVILAGAEDSVMDLLNAYYSR